MAHSGRSRGRPRGTGIDDSVHLEKMKQILDREPDLRPTTAIRLLGIQNESVIRRLRDKFHAAYGRDGDASFGRSSFRDERSDGPSVVALSSGLDNVRKSAVARPASRKQVETAKPHLETPAPVAATETAPDNQAAGPAAKPAAPAAPASSLTEPPALLVSALSTAVAAVNLLAVQQALLWRMTARHPMTAAFLFPTPAQCCPNCGSTRNAG